MYFSNQIFEAAARGDVNLVRKCLEKGTDINIKDPCGATALHRACVTGKFEVVKLLLDRGIRINALNKAFSTATHVACLYGKSEIAMYLVQNGADLDLRDNRGMTVVDLAQSSLKDSILQFKKSKETKDFKWTGEWQGENAKRNRVLGSLVCHSSLTHLHPSQSSSSSSSSLISTNTPTTITNTLNLSSSPSSSSNVFSSNKQQMIMRRYL